jgi:general secretion pathway protein L
MKMRIPAILNDWLEELSRALGEFGQRRQARRTVALREEGDRLVARRVDEPGAAVVADVKQGERLPDDALEALRGYVATLELSAIDFATRRLSVPLQAKDVLPGIVQNQLDRLSPWPIASVVYGYEAHPDKSDPKSLDVRLLISRRKTIDAIRQRVLESGLSLDRIVARAALDGTSAAPLTLWTRPTEARGALFAGSTRAIGVALAVIFLASAATTLWAALSANALRTEQAEIADRTDAIRRHVSARPDKKQALARNPAEQAWALKETSPTAVSVLEALTQALPDNAYLTELSLERATLRVTGFAADPPPLIAALEKSDRFSGAHFFAATTKNQDGGLYRFAIEAQVTPPTDVKEE